MSGDLEAPDLESVNNLHDCRLQSGLLAPVLGGAGGRRGSFRHRMSELALLPAPAHLLPTSHNVNVFFNHGTVTESRQLHGLDSAVSTTSLCEFC